MTSKKHILVTGGCGYIGSHIANSLCEAGYEVVVVDNLSTGFKESLPASAIFYQLDLSDHSALKEVFRKYSFDCIFHFAASVSVPESLKNPLMYYLNNTSNMINLLEICKTNNVKNFIFSSTAAVYGETIDSPVSEASPCNPKNPYGSSKLMSERILGDICSASEMNCVILRYFNVAGASASGNNGQRLRSASHLIKIACKAALHEISSVSVFGDSYPTRDGSGIRDYIHIEDLADAHVKSLVWLKQNKTSNIFNCGYGRGYSVFEVLASLKQVSKESFDVKICPPRQGDVAEMIADNSRIKKCLGWEPRYDDLNEIVRSAYEWEKHIMRQSKGGL